MDHKYYYSSHETNPNSKNHLGVSAAAVQNGTPVFGRIQHSNSASADLVLDRCSCLGQCAREHTGACPNRLDSLAAGSRWPTRLHLIGDRLLCTGCRQPYDPNKRWAY